MLDLTQRMELLSTRQDTISVVHLNFTTLCLIVRTFTGRVWEKNRAICVASYVFSL